MAYWHDIVPLPSRVRDGRTAGSSKPERIKEMNHSEFQIFAVIFKRSLNELEVRYYGNFKGSQESGWRLSIPQDLLTETGKLKFKVLTCADSLESAEEIARIELDKLAIIHRDEILIREERI